MRREPHASEILVVSEDGFENVVAENGVVEVRRDHLDEILLIQQPFELCFVGRSERDYRFFCSSHSLCLRGCVIGRGGFDETVRRHPDLREPAVDGRSQITFGRRGYCVLAGNVPRIITAQNPELPQLAYERLKTTSARRVFGLLPPPLVTHGGNGVIDRHGVAG